VIDDGSPDPQSGRVSPGVVVAVHGHESPDIGALRDLCGPQVVLVGRGRELFERVRGLLARPQRVCVVPMTLGRDPELAADAARALRALGPVGPVGERRVVLAEPFGTSQHLVGWLRAAAERVPASTALLVTAPASDPFADAELYRVARLVRQYGEHRLVEVAFSGGDPDVDEGLRRCRALGAGRIALLSASFTPPKAHGPCRSDTDEGVLAAGPLLSSAVVARVLDARVVQAWHRFDLHGWDGVDAALDAAHGHGFGHSHSHDHDHSHGHEHEHHDGSDHHDHHPAHLAGAPGARRTGSPRRSAEAFPVAVERNMA